jgi:hypothetical protein
MTLSSIKKNLATMESGECRWIGREDVHVYCRNPHNAAVPTYKVVTPKRPHAKQKWIEADDAAALIINLAND